MIDWSKDRYKRLVNFLIKTKKVVTINQLATKFNVSQRTIRNDLNKLTDFFNQLGIELNKKPGVGIWLELEQIDKEKLIDKIYDINEDKKKYSAGQRKKIIIKELLHSDQWITMNKLGKKLYVSRSTIYKDINWVKDWIASYNLNLQKRRNRGVKITGQEVRIREAIVNLLFEFLAREEFDQILYLLMTEKKLDTNQFELLTDFFGTINLQKIKNIVYDQLIKMNYQFSDRAILYIVLYIAISVKRIKQGQKITNIDNKEVIEELDEMEFFPEAMQLKQKFSTEFSIDISQEEFIAVIAQFFCLELEENYFLNNYQKILSNINGQVFNLVNDFLELVTTKLDINLELEEDLFLDFIFHINYIFKHVQYGVSRKKNFRFSQILLLDLEEKNKLVFNIVKQIKDLFPAKIKSGVQVEDLYYISILLLTAIKRNQNKAKVIIVCSKQNPTYKLLVAKLKNKLNCLEIIDVLSYYEVKYKELDDFDLLISCSDLDNQYNNVVISPIVNNEDIARILDKIDR
ncbi:MAG: BglG family transcription antiterminator [Bacillota bacterium]